MDEKALSGRTDIIRWWFMNYPQKS